MEKQIDLEEIVLFFSITRSSPCLLASSSLCCFFSFLFVIQSHWLLFLKYVMLPCPKVLAYNLSSAWNGLSNTPLPPLLASLPY